MIIMQTEDAEKRRDHIKANNLARVIFEQQHEDAVCVQYHPKDIKGAFVVHAQLLQAQASGNKRRRRHDTGTRLPQTRPN